MSDALALTGRDYHTRIRHGYADDRDDLGEGLVVDTVVELLGVDVVCGLDPRHADRVRADAVNRLEVLGVHKQSRELVAVKLESEKYAESYVVDTALHSAIHSLGVVVVVMLGTCGMKLLVALLIICLLEQDIGADTRVVELFVVLDRGGGNIHVYAADSAVLVLDRIDGLDALKDVLNRVVYGIFAGFDSKALMTHILQRDDLCLYLILSQLFAADVLVFIVIWAVNAAVHAVV